MKIDRSNPYVWGGEVEETQFSIGGREVADPSDRPTEFMREVPLPPGVEEEVAVPLGELYGDTEQEITRTGSIFGKAWGAVAERIW